MAWLPEPLVAYTGVMVSWPDAGSTGLDGRELKVSGMVMVCR